LAFNAPLKGFFGSFFPKIRGFGAYQCGGGQPRVLLTIMSKTDEHSKKHEVVFFIDKQQFKSDNPDLSVRTLLVDLAKEDPSQTTLASKHGNDLTKYTNLDQIVHIENGMKFVVLHNTPTPVS
jgi:hypothetical protein